jgi:hypothetical protein
MEDDNRRMSPPATAWAILEIAKSKFQDGGDHFVTAGRDDGKANELS